MSQNNRKLLIFDYFHPSHLESFRQIVNTDVAIKEYMDDETFIHYSCGNTSPSKNESTLIKSSVIREAFRAAIEDHSVVYLFGSFSYSLLCDVFNQKQENISYTKLVESEHKIILDKSYVFLNYSPGYINHYKSFVQTNPSEENEANLEKMKIKFLENIKRSKIFMDVLK